MLSPSCRLLLQRIVHHLPSMAVSLPISLRPSQHRQRRTFVAIRWPWQRGQAESRDWIRNPNLPTTILQKLPPLTFLWSNRSGMGRVQHRSIRHLPRKQFHVFERPYQSSSLYQDAPASGFNCRRLRWKHFGTCFSNLRWSHNPQREFRKCKKSSAN